MRHIRLLRILAPVVNGVDLSGLRAGDVVLVSDAVADMLIQERWAELVPESIRPPHNRPAPDSISTE